MRGGTRLTLVNGRWSGWPAPAACCLRARQKKPKPREGFGFF
ncbi:hypothetical protein B8V81_2130 [Paenibacillus pasadenensis]|uniref:Uncharacterized protein n=1 Tax=Paenibacillus pasadenensis TaxID=217090 RepID=A0A2N5N042_9BACL|nr:hypothetical protein B8V81_2130 [Paenibacillus pasadenensis]